MATSTRPCRLNVLPIALLLCASCDKKETPAPAPPPAAEPKADPAKVFIEEADDELRQLWIQSETKAWEQATNITPETTAAAASAQEQVMAFLGKAIPKAAEFDDAQTDPDTRRKLTLLKRATTLAAPADPAKRKELAMLAAEMQSMYGSGQYCKGDDCKDLQELTAILSDERNYGRLLDAWQGWRTVSVPMREKYQRFVELANEGAVQIGYADTGELWRSGYDMSAQDFEAEMERLWQQVKPLYDQLHCHVRARLSKKYGKRRVPTDGLIPAHLLGNMWAQEWGNIYPLIEPHKGQPSIDVTAALEAKEYDPKKMVKTAENFFVSLGLDPLPASFWERSMFAQPPDRQVVCHASAWDPSYADDLRIKMCIRPTMEDLITIHHELGHNYYFHYYHQLPALYQQGAHDGFHEGIGDTLALSVTPAYLKQIGLLDEVSDDPKAILNKQMQDALDKIAFLPFGLIVDKWRWGVFSGQIPPEQYNAAWWQLRQDYQGITPPVARTEEQFDPGAKYHIPANTPYARYFLARILQFQFHKALCEAAGHEGPLHTCSIYGSKEAGAKLRAMLELGASKPWPDALEAIAGTRQMDAGPLVEYFTPLMAYLEEQNASRTCGWPASTPAEAQPAAAKAAPNP
jgi:peptidyl-dipeptidase A